MSSNKSSSTPAPQRNRRSGRDRRVLDVGPLPGQRERRVNMESRKPDVQEVDLTASDWASFDQSSPLTPKKTGG